MEMEIRENESTIDKKKERQKVLKNFGFYCLGVFLCWSSYVTLFNLQSSINVEDGMGTTAVGISYFVSIIFAVFVAPVLVNKFGSKICVIIGDTAMILFFVANLYPTYATLLIAGMLMTSLQSPQWPSMSMINTLFATEYSALSKKPEDVHIISFSGYFFTSFQASQVFGNMLSYIILYGYEQLEDSSITNSSIVNSFETDYSSCGAADCQNATIVEERIGQYKPVNRVSLYVLIGVALVLEVSSILIHAIFLPNEQKLIKTTEFYKQSMISKDDDKNCSNKRLLEGDEIADKVAVSESSQNGENGTVQFEVVTEQEQNAAGICELITSTARSLSKHVIRLKFVLLVPITLYNGLSMSFAFSELTRAYASCALGVQWVGVCMALYGVSDAILSWVVGNFGRKIGRIQCYLFALTIECGNYIYCLFWKTGPHTLLSVFFIFFMFGFTDGIFQTIINVTHIDFAEDQKSALATWNILIVIGFSMGFVLSTAFCVSSRIYFNMGFVITGCILLVIADIYHRNHGAKKEREKNHELQDKS